MAVPDCEEALSFHVCQSVAMFEAGRGTLLKWEYLRCMDQLTYYASLTNTEICSIGY
jgi:hypothetical protein